jgi:uncharacterized repeat protein (TIGR02543 family)
MYAHWTPVSYAITYKNLENRTDNSKNPVSYTIESGPIPLQDPVRFGGFNFEGWYDNGEFNGSPISEISADSRVDKTFWAKWTVLVTFDSVGGSPVPGPETVVEGEGMDEPAAMNKVIEGFSDTAGLYTDLKSPGWYNFEGWYSEDSDTKWNFEDPVTSPLNLYAKWTGSVNLSSVETGNNILEKALNYIENDTSGAKDYTIMLSESFQMNGVSPANINKPGVTITLVGNSSTEISLTSAGSLFNITAGELVLGNNITLTGYASNNAALVYVDGGSLTMRDGAAIKDNKNSSTGGGVYINSGSFTMEGGEISYNSSGMYGGGVYIRNGSSFIKTGGIIANNTAFRAMYGHSVFHSLGRYLDGPFYAEDDIDSANASGWPKHS